MSMLKVISTYEFEKLIENIHEIECEFVDILDSYGRILDEDIYSPVNIPGFKRSAVDGYAVMSRDTYLCSETMPGVFNLKEEIEIGKKPNEDLSGLECSYIPTGGMLPNGADSVVMIEDTEVIGNEIFVNKSVSKNENVVSEDEDISKDDKIFSKGDLMLSTHMPVLISLGVKVVKVKRQIKIGVISTGDELIDIKSDIEVPKIKDSNGPFLAFAAREDRCISKHYGIVKDDEEILTSTVKKALAENDMVFLSGGSSAGNKDFTEKIISELGELMFHGLSIKPGKPTLMGRCSGNKYIIGFPGHPLACMIVYKFIISKLINHLYGKKENITYQVLEFGENYHKSKGREEYLAIRIEDNKAYPIHAKSSAMSVMIKCDGILKIDRDIEGYQKGDKVNVMR